MAQNPGEIFDVVDACDVVLRQETRARVHALKLFHRAVHVLVFNPAGELYLQKRSLAKDSCPGRWTTSCSGHVDTGEDYDGATRRELGEELGIHLPATVHPDWLFKHGPCRETGYEFIQVYRLEWSGEITPDPAEIAEGCFVDEAALNRWLIKRPRDFAGSFRLVWREYLARRG
jgi:isopentenyldiphosphate isomerase